MDEVSQHPSGGSTELAGLPPVLEALLQRLVLEPQAEGLVAEIEASLSTRDDWIAVLARTGALSATTPPAQRRELSLVFGGWYLDRVGAPEFAASCYRFVLGLDPDDPRALRGLLAACAAMGDPAQQNEALTAVAERHPSPVDRANAWISLGKLAAERGDLAGSEGALRRAVETAPTYLPGHHALAEVLECAGRPEDACDVLTELAFLPAPPGARALVWLQIARLSEQALDDPSAAADAYRQALALDPQSEAAAHGVDRHSTSDNERQDAISLLTAELSSNRSERERIAIRYRLAALYEKAGSLTQAATMLDAVLERAPEERRASMELIRLYQTLGDWRRLADTHLHDAQQTPDREERVALLLLAAHQHATHDSLARATELVREALSMAPEDPQVLEDLAEYCERAGETEPALEALHRCRSVTSPPIRRAALWMRSASILERKRDAEGEWEALQQALRDDPSLREPHDRLAALCLARCDAVQAARHLELAAEMTDGLERARRLEALAQIEGNELGQAGYAADHLLLASELRVDDLALAERAARAQIDAGHPARAAACLERVTAALGDRRGERAHELWSGLAVARRAQGESWQELTALRKAFEADPRDVDTVCRLADLYVSSGDHESAAPLYERVWPQVDSTIRGPIALKAARAREAHGDTIRATTWYRRAFEADPTHLDAIRGMARAYRQRCEWRKAADLEEQTLTRLEGDKRLEALQSLSELCDRHLRDPARAARVLAQALEMDAASRALLVRLLGLQSQAAQWTAALDTLDRLERIEDDPIVAARVAVTRAHVLRDEIHDERLAARSFERALDLDANDAAGAFIELCAMWSASGRDQEICACYRRMIDRQKDCPERRRSLLDELGSHLKDEMGDLRGGLEVYAEAMALEPSNLARVAVMADLAERTGQLDDALVLHQLLVVRPPASRASLRALRRIYSETGDPVAAGWAAAALLVVDEADEDDGMAFAAIRDEVRPPEGLLSEADWLKLLLHPDADPRLGKLLQIAAPIVHAVRSSSGEDLALADEKPVPTATETVFAWASSMLGVGRPAVRACNGPGAPDGIAVWPGRVPMSVVGPIEDRYRAEDCAFLIGHHLAYYRADHFLVQLAPDPRELCAIALAAARIADSRLRAPIELTDLVASWTERLYLGLGPEMRSRLSRLVPLLECPIDVYAIQRWMRGAELSAIRAGLLVSGDLCAAVRQVKRMHGGRALCDIAIEDLVAFSASPAHLDLRARLGQRVAPRRPTPAEFALVTLPPPPPPTPGLLSNPFRKATPRPTSTM